MSGAPPAGRGADTRAGRGGRGGGEGGFGGGGTYPLEYRSGFGDEGVKALQEFVQAGGTLVTCAEAGALALSRWRGDFDQWAKSDASPVCEVDLAVDALLRERLLATAGRLHFRFSNVMLWHTRGGMANAMVVGLLPWPRYIVLTDRLVEDFSDY